ncbi:putative lipid II flippase MurJ [Agaricicola taiwanensis]|uniref:Probable lipid II flippase MurJ n=1 Tax=Agaricicola taiwanensis TaxID=591372 RepID=A0A8J2YJ50_9RHOB|nr:murein biosynthesis integral membrane protein MurJ [Agaricicola taiwanensis]GGE46094.1 putative lipid II flippase MurJ [Agaricicola taiwanensis]
MWRKVASVGGLTLVSRVFGFARDVLMAAVLGAGPLGDAFMVAFRLPNHFRAIFAEGAFNAAFVPRYAGTLAASGPEAAKRFASGILGWTLLVHAILLVTAFAAMPWLVGLLAPGFTDDAGQFAQTVELTRITFPYLVLISIVTLISGMLNAHERFAAAAAAPILLNICLIGALLLAPWFPDAAYALAWGVLAAGFAELAFVLWDLRRANIGLGLRKPSVEPETRDFLKGFLPATLGSAGTQIAMFADTIIASFLPSGSVSFLYYADRLYQLPVAIIGIAIGTVLLPDLARRLASGDHTGANRSFNRAIEGSIILGLPFVIVFALEATAVIAVMFGRGAFDARAVEGSAAALAAYAVGLIAVLMLRPVTASFYARRDTLTPVLALGIATAVNVGLKILLVGSMAHAGLALATSVGAWINLLVLFVILMVRGHIVPDRRLIAFTCIAVAAAVAMAAVLWGLRPMVAGLPDLLPVFPGLLPLGLRGAAAASAYLVILGIAWRLLARRLPG